MFPLLIPFTHLKTSIISPLALLLSSFITPLFFIVSRPPVPRQDARMTANLDLKGKCNVHFEQLMMTEFRETGK